MAHQKWKIFTNKAGTRYITARHNGTGSHVVYDGDSEVEALRALIKATIWTDATPVIRDWTDKPINEYETFAKGRKEGQSRPNPSAENWHPSKYEN